VTPKRTVLFVCAHGAAKSVLAATDFTRMARERGLDLAADSRGTDPDPEIAPAVARRLMEEGVDLRGRRPARLTREDVQRAWKVVAFGCDLGSLTPPGGSVEHWAEIPAVSDDLDTARAAIRARLERLLAECSRDR
jgi:protein-tyrosine-phosphatase